MNQNTDISMLSIPQLMPFSECLSASGQQQNTHDCTREEQIKCLAELRTEVTVQVGSLILTGRQLIEMRPEQTFEFRLDAETPITLSVEGEEIARGKLVATEKSFGIEIIEVLE